MWWKWSHSTIVTKKHVIFSANLSFFHGFTTGCNQNLQRTTKISQFNSTNNVRVNAKKNKYNYGVIKRIKVMGFTTDVERMSLDISWTTKNSSYESNSTEKRNKNQIAEKDYSFQNRKWINKSTCLMARSSPESRLTILSRSSINGEAAPFARGVNSGWSGPARPKPAKPVNIWARPGPARK